MTGRRFAGVVAAMTLAVGASSMPPSGAAPHDKTVTKTITAVCSLNMHQDPPPPPVPEDFVVTTTAPQRVKRGSPFTVSLSVPFSVSSEAQFGAMFFGGGPGASPTDTVVGSAPGSTRISGSASFTAIGAPGSTLTWRLGYFGQQAHLAGLTIIEICIPTRTFTLSRTRIT